MFDLDSCNMAKTPPAKVNYNAKINSLSFSEHQCIQKTMCIVGITKKDTNTNRDALISRLTIIYGRVASGFLYF